ncbi:uncharacterized protein LOC127108242 isoform X3 [Lathyrus oleraceus]|uniref:uncharacterized protein LOC127108242 isoform X3 n=1 Tax=Pisum sativum TaxID=3888 RepID=UPI0021D32C9E|nr:uncharacterized protein LOC127108242 isoform X3 [Pisum sativum]
MRLLIFLPAYVIETYIFELFVFPKDVVAHHPNVVSRGVSILIVNHINKLFFSKSISSLSYPLSIVSSIAILIAIASAAKRSFSPAKLQPISSFISFSLFNSFEYPSSFDSEAHTGVTLTSMVMFEVPLNSSIFAFIWVSLALCMWWFPFPRAQSFEIRLLWWLFSLLMHPCMSYLLFLSGEFSLLLDPIVGVSSQFGSSCSYLGYSPPQSVAPIFQAVLITTSTFSRSIFEKPFGGRN